MMGPFYQELDQRKQTGEKLDFSHITYEDLKRLWWDETIPDSIAKNPC